MCKPDLQLEKGHQLKLNRLIWSKLFDKPLDAKTSTIVVEATYLNEN